VDEPEMVVGETRKRNSAPELRTLRHAFAVFRAVFELNGCEVSPQTWEKQEEVALIWALRAITDKVSWVEVIKYKRAALAAYLLDQEQIGNLPIPPPTMVNDKPWAVFGGVIGRWVRKVLKYSPARFSFAQTLLNCKGIMPRTSEPFTMYSLKDTFKVLTDPAPQPQPIRIYGWDDIPLQGTESAKNWRLPADFNTQLDLAGAVAQIKRTVRELKTSLGRFEPTDSRFLTPSNSSAYSVKRSTGGNFNFVRGAFEETFQKLWSSLPGNQTWAETTGQHPDFPRRVPIYSYNPSKLIALDSVYRNMLEEMAQNAENKVTLVGLTEALKTRVISQADPFRQTYLASMQKWLHGGIKHVRPFLATGAPVTEEYVTSVLGSRPLEADEWILSGDYSAATDLLLSVHSEAVADALLEEGLLESSDYQLLLEALTRHDIVNPLRDDDVRPQARGQLMGSIVSFPVLCIINAALIRYLCEVSYRRVFTLEQAPMIINGDDNLSRLRAVTGEYPRSPLQLLKDAAHLFGFKLSVGKTYQSKRVAIVNSMMFEFLPQSFTKQYTRSGVPLTVHYYRQTPYCPLTPFGEVQGRSVLGESILSRSRAMSKAEKLSVLDDLTTHFLGFKRWINLGEDPRTWLDDHYLSVTQLYFDRAGIKLQTVFELRPKEPEPTDTTLEILERVLGSTTTKGVSLGDTVAWCLERVPKHMRMDYYTAVIAFHKEALTRCKLPIWIPKAFGGLGFPLMHADGSLTHDTDAPLAFFPSLLDRMLCDGVMRNRDPEREPKAVTDQSDVTFQLACNQRYPKKTRVVPMLRDGPSAKAAELVKKCVTFQTWVTCSNEELRDPSDQGRGLLAAKAVEFNQKLYSLKEHQKHLCPRARAPSATLIYATDREYVREKLVTLNESGVGFTTPETHFELFGDDDINDTLDLQNPAALTDDDAKVEVEPDNHRTDLAPPIHGRFDSDDDEQQELAAAHAEGEPVRRRLPYFLTPHHNRSWLLLRDPNLIT